MVISIPIIFFNGLIKFNDSQFIDFSTYQGINIEFFSTHFKIPTKLQRLTRWRVHAFGNAE